jgi:predicted nucleotidyltransferase component of viral defense system
LIPQAYIIHWQKNAPWPDVSMVEQDLVISRALVDMFRHPVLKDNLAFRGGTALFKLYLPAVRYSEDIDLVQINPGPIGPLMDGLREALSPWLGAPKWKQTQGRVTFKFRFLSEEDVPLTLKVEINSREHFSVYGLQRIPFYVDSPWYNGQARILTYDLEELLATKLRALYQRKKGRDMFDLWHAFQAKRGEPDSKRIVYAFQKYMDHAGVNVTRAMYEENMHAKCSDPQFANDIRPLLRPDIHWDFASAFDFLKNELIRKLPGEAWKYSKD